MGIFFLLIQGVVLYYDLLQVMDPLLCSIYDWRFLL